MDTHQHKTFAEAAASYVEHGGEAKHIPKILPHLGHLPLTTIVPFDVKQLAMSLYDKQSNATRNRQVIMPIRAVFYYAYERGWGPLIRIRNFKEDPPKRKKAATPAWLHAFVRQCDQGSPRSSRGPGPIHGPDRGEDLGGA